MRAVALVAVVALACRRTPAPTAPDARAAPPAPVAVQGAPGVADDPTRSYRVVEVREYEELGMEAVWRIEVEDFPAFIVVDDKGNDFFAGIAGGAHLKLAT